MAITIYTKRVQRDVSWYATNRLRIGTLLESSRGNLIRVMDYSEKTETDPAFYWLIIVNRNERWQPLESDVLRGIEQGNLWEVEIC
jgi:hypothetical protein